MTDKGQIVEAVQSTLYPNEQNGKPSDFAPFIPKKAQLNGTIIGAALGEHVCKALKKGERICGLLEKQ